MQFRYFSFGVKPINNHKKIKRRVKRKNSKCILKKVDPPPHPKTHLKIKKKNNVRHNTRINGTAGISLKNINKNTYKYLSTQEKKDFFGQINQNYLEYFPEWVSKK